MTLNTCPTNGSLKKINTRELGKVNHPFLNPQEAIAKHIPEPNKTIHQTIEEEFRKHPHLREWRDSGDVE